VTRGLDWQRARMQEALFALQTANGKVPFTDEGIRLVAAAIYGVLSDGVDVGLYAKDPKPTVTAPRASAVSGANRSARSLPSVTFAAQLAGAPIKRSDIFAALRAVQGVTDCAEVLLSRTVVNSVSAAARAALAYNLTGAPREVLKLAAGRVAVVRAR
jgi:hypothetical protein